MLLSHVNYSCVVETIHDSSDHISFSLLICGSQCRKRPTVDTLHIDTHGMECWWTQRHKNICSFIEPPLIPLFFRHDMFQIQMVKFKPLIQVNTEGALYWIGKEGCLIISLLQHWNSLQYRHWLLLSLSTGHCLMKQTNVQCIKTDAHTVDHLIQWDYIKRVLHQFSSALL